jgi:hypothetical protein
VTTVLLVIASFAGGALVMLAYLLQTGLVGC